MRQQISGLSRNKKFISENDYSEQRFSGVLRGEKEISEKLDVKAYLSGKNYTAKLLNFLVLQGIQIPNQKIRLWSQKFKRRGQQMIITRSSVVFMACMRQRMSVPNTFRTL